MPLVWSVSLYRKFIRAHPNRLFVFGDNFEQCGFGGQARQCRGEPNTIGIPTKRLPSMVPHAFLTDADLDEWRRQSAPAFARIADALERGQSVVMPAAGIGTGLADLERRAPAIWEALNIKIKAWEEKYNTE